MGLINEGSSLTSPVPIDNEEAAELARRLHDGPLQIFHAIRLHLGALRKRTGPQDSALIGELSEESLKGLEGPPESHATI